MLEHFPPWSTMVAFDIAFVALAMFTTVFVIGRARQLKAAKAQFGAVLLLTGIWLIAGLYATDFVSMTVLPLFFDMARAMAFMRDIHVKYSWYVTITAQAALVFGLILVVGRLLRQQAAQQAAVERAALEIKRRAQSERDLRESEERYEQAAEIARLGYYIWDAVEDRCIFCSPTHASFHGVTPSEYIAQASTLDGPFSLTPEPDRERVREAYRRLRSGHPIAMEYNLDAGDRTIRVREIARPVFDAEGAVIREIGTTLDITEQHQAERRLRRSERLDSIGQLSGGVAHDFNNLLAIIIGNLELLDEEDLSQMSRECVSSATVAAHRGADLTQNLLTFARKADLTPEQVDLNKLVRDAQNWIGRTIPANIEIETSLLARLWRVDVDRASVENAFLNLVVNARDAMPEGGRLTIETSNVRIDDEHNAMHDSGVAEGRYVLLAVSDTGVGIAPDNLDRVFEPFFTTKDDGTGSGLGLSSIQGFMAQSGGAVRVYSELGVGTTFKLYFPAVTGATRPGAAPDLVETGEAMRPLRILLAEDQDEVRAVLLRQLELAGHKAVACASGDEALAHFKRDRAFDLVISDIVMPGDLQGPSLIKALRELEPSLQAIFVSGYASEATVHGNGLRPEDLRLMKPVRRLDLLKALQQVVKARRAQDEKD